MKYNWTTGEAWGKTSAALGASTGLFVAFIVFCAVALPVARPAAVVIGVLGGLPLWVAAMCYAVLARSACRAWGVLLGGATLLTSIVSLTWLFS